MNTISNRIAQCINASGLTKTAFAKKIGLTQAYVSALSIGRKLPSDRTILDICREFNINENWLRTGNGKMFKETPDTLACKLSKMYGLDNLGSQIMSAYLKLDTNDRLAVGRMIKNLIDENISTSTYTDTRPRDEKPVKDWTDKDIEDKVEEYRCELLAEKKQAEKSSDLSDTNEKMA